MSANEPDLLPDGDDDLMEQLHLEQLHRERRGREQLPQEPARSPSRYVDPNERRNRSVRLTDSEWTKVQAAAGRTPESKLERYCLNARWYYQGPAAPLTWMRAVCLDYAEHVNALPKGKEGQLPGAALKDLHERIALLESKLRAAGIDPNGPAPVEHKGKATTRRVRKAAGGGGA